MAYVPIAFILAGMAAYTVLAGADFGAGLWTLLSFAPSGRSGPPGQRIRDQARHAMGPVWEANHVWLIFVLVVCWTAYPVAYGSITSTLAAPLLIAAIGIILRGAAYALRSVAYTSAATPAAENLLGVSSVITPFALGTAVGAIATGRVPVGNAAGNLVTSWLAPAPVLIGVLAVAFSGYLAAVFLAADSVRYAEPDLAAAFRRRALAAGVVSGGLALAGFLVIRGSGLDLTRGAALGLVCVSGAAGLGTLALCWASRFGLARLTAALAVAAVVVGWAAAQAPRFLPGMTVTQAAAGDTTLVALVIAVVCGCVVLVPSLALLFTLFLRGRLDTPESHALGEAPTAIGEISAETTAGGVPGAAGRARGSVARPRDVRRWGAAAVVGLVAGVALLIFTDAPWTHALGVVGLLLCAVSVFALTATPLDHLPGPVDRASPGLDFDFLSVTWGSQRYGVCAKVTL